MEDTGDPSVAFHSSIPLSSEFIAAFESARDDDSFDRHVGALRDVSGIYATNLALQHISKSPMLVRNWKRVIDELTGRHSNSRKGAPQFRPGEIELEMKFANNSEPPGQDHSARLDGTPDILKSTSPPVKVGATVVPTLSSPEFILDASTREDTPTRSNSLIDDHSFPHHKTQADRGLDQEFIHYLRLNIARKRTEVELLKQLETQRLKMIHRLERVLSRKSLELLASKEASV